MSFAINAVTEFVEMADRVEKVIYSGADQEDIYRFVRDYYDSVSESTGIKVNWEWYDYYGGDCEYIDNARNLRDEINKKADSLRKLLAAINNEE